MSYTLHWKIFTDANRQDKAAKVMRRVLSKLQTEALNVKIEPYHKGGFTCTFDTSCEIDQWSDVVLYAIALAQSIGRGWLLSGDIRQGLEAWSNDSPVVGVKNVLLCCYEDA